MKTQKINSVGIACILIIMIGVAHAVDYCDKSLCSRRKHIACHNRGRFSMVCPKKSTLVRMQPHIEHIVRLHNEIRNWVASGSLIGFEPAQRMATMQWDVELSNLAVLNVKRCRAKNDGCRNTFSFKNVGQNVGLDSYPRSVKESDRQHIENIIMNWLEERKHNATKSISLFRAGAASAKYWHFLLMIRDRNPRVGCGAVRFRRDNLYQFLFTCNYATNNVIGQPIYVEGEQAVGCQTGTHSQYQSLCSVKEIYGGL